MDRWGPLEGRDTVCAPDTRGLSCLAGDPDGGVRGSSVVLRSKGPLGLMGEGLSKPGAGAGGDLDAGSPLSNLSIVKPGFPAMMGRGLGTTGEEAEGPEAGRTVLYGWVIKVAG